jgi:hypothetical protein
MPTLRVAFPLVGLAFLWTSCGNADAQEAGHSSTGVKQQVLSLDFTNNGQHLAATVGQQIEITLRAKGACEPQVSSPAIRLESVAEDWPSTPGISTYFYIFDAAAQGEAQVKVPMTDCSNPDLPGGATFTVTIRVGQAAGEPFTPYASRTTDQANTASWKDGWINLQGNFLRQAFTPSLPRLTGVEVELVAGNPGPASAEVTMTLLNAKGEVLSLVSKTVAVGDCGHVLFVLPKGGWPVSPGQVYSIEVNGGRGVFGWKYVEGGYKNGAASFNGKPLLRNARGTFTFLFRTFGSS